MKISFAVTTHNEGLSVNVLLNQLSEEIERGLDAEIVILDDHSDDEETVHYLHKYSNLSYVSLHFKSLNGDFGEHKNYLNSLCVGDFIFQIDADERLSPHLLTWLPEILSSNSEVDLFLIPRINTVNGLTQEHISKWGWVVNDRGYILFPDYQSRLYRRNDVIKWAGKVHERIVGYDLFANLPTQEEYCLIHEKSIDKQEHQNKFYSELIS